MEFLVKTRSREEIVDMTREVENAVSKLMEAEKKIVCNKKSRVCLIYTPHTTCSIIINEFSDKNVCEDILHALKKLVPENGWKHDCEEGNADAHIKSIITGNEKVVPLENGKLMLGKWQRIGLAEFDGSRERRIIVQLI